MTDPITPLTPAQTAQEETQAAHEAYLHRFLVGFDQFMNVVTDGDPDETISSRSARAALRGKKWGIAMSKFLDKFQNDHGADAMSGDLERAEAVEKLEEQTGELNQS